MSYLSIIWLDDLAMANQSISFHNLQLRSTDVHQYGCSTCMCTCALASKLKVSMTHVHVVNFACLGMLGMLGNQWHSSKRFSIRNDFNCAIHLMSGGRTKCIELACTAFMAVYKLLVHDEHDKADC